MRFSHWIILGFGIVGAIALAGCETKEDRDIYSAQLCLNGIGTRIGNDLSDYVDGCLSKVVGYDNPHANIIKCSGYFLKGGLTNAAIINAFDSTKGLGGDKEATLISLLSLGNNATAKTNADNAYYYCNRTNVAGLAYVASLSRMGTYVDQYAGVDIKDQIATLIGTGAAADADKQAIGEMAVTLGSLYCKGEAKDSNICIEINSVKQQAGNDYILLAELLLNEFAN